MRRYKIIWAIVAIIMIVANIFTIYITKERHYISVYNAWMLSITILLIIPFMYIFLLKKIKHQIEESMITISRILTTQNNDTNTKTSTKLLKNYLYRFLDFDEKKIIEKIAEKNGFILQSELSRLTNMNKVRLHRLLQNMRKREIISIERYGKTNRIILTEDVKKILLNNII